MSNERAGPADYSWAYANPGTEPFYARLGFLRITTAMAIWHDPGRAIESALLSTTV